MIKKFLLSAFLSTAVITGGFSQNSQKTTAAINLNWQELGPTNSGGKVKALLADRVTAGRVFAAAASGGLWQTTDNGLNWTKVKDDFDNNIITCITQSSNGNIYIGTGERAYGFIGGGIWKSTDGGSSFTLLTATIPATLNDSTSAFAYINALAADSTNTDRVYAATNRGLMVTSDGGTTWANAIPGFNTWSTDVKVAKDGFVIAAVDSLTSNSVAKKKMSAWVSASGNAGSFTQVSGAGSGKLPNTAGAFSVKFAIAPSDANYIYAAVVKHYRMVGIYKSTDKGNTWSVIGPGGASTFNPFGSNAGSPASYAYTLIVDPSDKDFLFAGGQDVYTYTPAQNWSQLTTHYAGPAYPLYCHENIHSFIFTKDHLWVASDGGVSKGSAGVSGFVVINNGLANMQVNDLAPKTNGDILLSTNGNGIAIMGSNGGSSSTLNHDNEVNTGGSIYASYINPNASFIAGEYGWVLRSNKTESGTYGHLYNDRILNKTTMNIANIRSLGAANKKTPFAYWESKNDPLSKDSMLYTNNTHNTIPAGTLFTAISPNAFQPFTTISNIPIDSGQTVKVPHKVQARIAIGFNSEVWIGDDALDFIGTPDWYRAAGFKSLYYTPPRVSDSTKILMKKDAVVSTITFTANGNTLLFAATLPGPASDAGAYLYKLSNIAAAYDSINGDVSSDSCQLTGGQIGYFANRNISSIAVDPSDSNKVVIVMNDYNNNSYVYRTSTLMTLGYKNDTSNFENIQTNLPKMPVYDALIDYNNSNQIILGTEAGVYSTDNGFASSPTAVSWGASNNGIAKVPVMALSQQTRNYTEAANSGHIYAGTFGRGVFKTATLAGFHDELSADKVNSAKTLLAYPNPSSDNITVKYKLGKDSQVSVKMFDITGKLVYINSSNTAAGNNTHLIKVSDFDSGVYVITVTGNEIKEHVNIIVTK